jgi:hypothetical protein
VVGLLIEQDSQLGEEPGQKSEMFHNIGSASTLQTVPTSAAANVIQIVRVAPFNPNFKRVTFLSLQFHEVRRP